MGNADISKHLMLLFIRISVNSFLERKSISKHLMLLFINAHAKNECCAGISKHLMLLFIVMRIFAFFCPFSFQNILCYCLSIRSNTGRQGRDKFQNILCYCLSLAFPRFLVSPLPFFPLYFLYFSIFYQPTPLSWTALLIIP